MVKEVSHSLQSAELGLISTEAIVLACLDSLFKDILISVYGLTFLGTPHHGSNLANIAFPMARVGEYLDLGPESLLLQDLRRGSNVLWDLAESFRCVDEKYKFAIVCFYEKLKTQINAFQKRLVSCFRVYAMDSKLLERSLILNPPQLKANQAFPWKQITHSSTSTPEPVPTIIYCFTGSKSLRKKPRTPLDCALKVDPPPKS